MPNKKRERDRNFRLGFRKLGFTLAEILIVLTVIGVIATITIPQLTGGVDEAQIKAGLKKAYTTLANVAEMEKAEGNLPQSASEEGIISFFMALNNNLEVEGYAKSLDSIDNEPIIKQSDIKMGVSWKNHTFGDENDLLTDSAELSHRSPWIITADGMAYNVNYGDDNTCNKKSYLNASNRTYVETTKAQCLAIVVDVNGLNKGPNSFYKARGALSSTKKLGKLTDRFYIFIASDGIAKGSPSTSIVGRLLAGEK